MGELGGSPGELPNLGGYEEVDDDDEEDAVGVGETPTAMNAPEPGALAALDISAIS